MKPGKLWFNSFTQKVNGFKLKKVLILNSVNEPLREATKMEAIGHYFDVVLLIIITLHKAVLPLVWVCNSSVWPP